MSGSTPFNFIRTRYRDEFMCVEVFRIECVYRDQKFYAQARLLDEYAYSLSPLVLQDVINRYWYKLEKQLLEAMAAYDIENPLPKVIKHGFATLSVSQEEAELSKSLTDYIQNYLATELQEKIKDQLKQESKSYHDSGSAMDLYVNLKPKEYKPPAPTYRDKAPSEFEGVEELDPTLWNGEDLA